MPSHTKVSTLSSYGTAHAGTYLHSVFGIFLVSALPEQRRHDVMVETNEVLEYEDAESGKIIVEGWVPVCKWLSRGGKHPAPRCALSC